MRPLDLQNFYIKRDTDFIFDCVLDMLSSYKSSTTVQVLINDCLRFGISSPATTHKRLALGKNLGFIETVDHAEDKDRRKTYIRATTKGLDYLHAWGMK